MGSLYESQKSVPGVGKRGREGEEREGRKDRRERNRERERERQRNRERHRETGRLNVRRALHALQQARHIPRCLSSLLHSRRSSVAFVPPPSLSLPLPLALSSGRTKAVNRSLLEQVGAERPPPRVKPRAPPPCGLRLCQTHVHVDPELRRQPFHAAHGARLQRRHPLRHGSPVLVHRRQYLSLDVERRPPRPPAGGGLVRVHAGE